MPLRLPDQVIVRLATPRDARMVVRRADIDAAFEVRIAIDDAHARRMTYDVIVVRHYGAFVRIPGEDAFWPSASKFGMTLEIPDALDHAQERAQTELALTATGLDWSFLDSRGGSGMKLPTHKRGRKR